MERERVFELFCGAGGMSTGFTPYFDITYAVDINETAVRTYQSNHYNTEVRRQDVRTISGARGDFEGITGIIGGPPCQCFSRRNIKKKADDPRIHLMQEYMRLVDEIQPRFFVLENVPYTPKEQKNAIIALGKQAGYTVISKHLNAAEYGSSQTRRRWVVIGTKDKPWIQIMQRPAKTVRQAFQDLTENWGVMQSSKETLEKTALAKPNEWTALSGGTYKNLIKLQWDLPSPAVANMKKVYMIHPGLNRNISLAEAAALQGFSPDYIWKGPDMAIAQMIANAMPSELADCIAASLIDRHDPQMKLITSAALCT